MSKGIVDKTLSEIEDYCKRLENILGSVPEGLLWSKPKGVSNSIGNLSLHIIGNLNHYYGAGILDNGYSRNKPNEFIKNSLSKVEVISELRSALKVAQSAFGILDDEKLLQSYRTPCGKEYALLLEHLIENTTHLAYHVGEAYYLLKLLGNN